MRRFLTLLLLGVVGCEGRIEGGTRPPLADEGRTDCSQPAEPGKPLLWRLTPQQFRNTATALVGGRFANGLAIPAPPALGELPFEAEPQLGRYSGQPAGVTVQEDDLGPLLAAAQTAGTLAVAALKRQAGTCVQQGYKPNFGACLRIMLQERAMVVQGRRLEPAAVEALAARVTATQPTLTNDEALGLGLTLLLVSPYALFRRELPGEQGALSREDLAVAMAFSLTDAPPDQPLWLAAMSGALETPEGRRAQIDRLLAEPERVPALQRFVVEHFRVAETNAVAKDPVKFSFHSPRQLELETGRLVNWLLDTSGQAGFLQQALTTRVAFVSRQTARSYDVEWPMGQMNPVVQMTLGPERSGLLTQPALLSALSHTDETDAVKRGHFVSESLLCVKVPPLPIGLVPELPDLGPNATPRARLAIHSQGDCWGCHQLMDPIGLGMEDFDHVGRKQGRDASGKLVGTDSQLDQDFIGTADLGAKLAGAPVVHACFAQHLHAFLSGRQPFSQDRCTAQEAANASLAANGDLRPLIDTWFSSPTFLTRVEQP